MFKNEFVPEELMRATMAKRFSNMAFRLTDVIVGVNVKGVQNECDQVKRKLVTDFIRSASPEEIIKNAARINSTMNR